MDNPNPPPNQPPWPPPPPPHDPSGGFNPRNPWQEARRRAGMPPGSGPQQRIGDAERNEMAELLGKHYADGRLDESEFRERLDRAMSAKTRGDLAGLLSDLPPLGQAPAARPTPRPTPRRRHRMRTLALALLVVVFVASLGSAMWPLFSVWPLHARWLLIAIVAFLLLRRHHWHRHGRDRASYPGSRGANGWGPPPAPPQQNSWDPPSAQPQRNPQGVPGQDPWR